MNHRYSPTQLSRVLDQALMYQCACPAQVCRAIFELRELHDYQHACGNDTANDAQVHGTIADATARAHAELEECLSAVLALEGWDAQTLTMPEALRKKVARAV